MKEADDILDYAIGREQEAHDFYLALANRVTRPGMKELFSHFAGEELGHKRKLEGVKAGRLSAGSSKKVQDLKIAEYVVDVEESPNMELQDALILAMKREKASFRLYTDLSASVEEPELSELFLALAQEEAKHKLRFEVEYDDVILAEN